MFCTSVLDRSVPTRRRALYRVRGLDIELWHKLTAEGPALKEAAGSCVAVARTDRIAIDRQRGRH
jgi:hypothetical protein